jgi:lipoyl-dependent peroxiredoxin
MISKASARYEGNIKTGRGTMKPAHGSEVAFGFGTRFEGVAGSNPEELIGAALAGCFSMALTGNLGRAGFEPQSIDTSANVELTKGETGFTITAIALITTGQVPGIDAAKFEEIAQQTKQTCPVSRALTGTKISLQAKLG